MTTQSPAIFLMGPTASGKTDLALKLIERLPCEIISVDSVMIYRDMDIGTAKPDEEFLQKAPHRLINICNPSQSYSAAKFAEDALQQMYEIQQQGKIPLLVGGTFLYFRALEQGLSPLPAADVAIREKLEQQAQKIGWPAMHTKLQQVDPVAAERIHPNDPQRIQRALEVYELAGRPMSELFNQQHVTKIPFQVSKLILILSDRSALHDRIAVRFQKMLDEGFVSEVESLYQRGDLHTDLPAIRAVGYRQIWDYLDGKSSYDEMVEKGIIATRQYAKRQMTWLRSEQNGHHIDAFDGKLLDKVLKCLAQDGIHQ